MRSTPRSVAVTCSRRESESQSAETRLASSHHRPSLSPSRLSPGISASSENRRSVASGGAKSAKTNRAPVHRQTYPSEYSYTHGQAKSWHECQIVKPRRINSRTVAPHQVQSRAPAAFTKGLMAVATHDSLIHNTSAMGTRPAAEPATAINHGSKFKPTAPVRATEN